MADENKKSDIKETLGSLKALRDQASAVNGINVEYKESIDLLTKMNKLIENSVAKTQSFEKSTINTKRIQTELEKIEKERKKVLSDIAGRDQRQAQEYIENIETRKNLDDKLIRSRGAGNSAATRALQSQLTSIQSVISAQESSLQTEDLMLIALTQQQQSLDQRVEGLKEEIEKEKQIGDKVGIVGNLLKLSNKYLGIGGDLYGKIVSETREGENTTKKWVYTVGALVGSIALVSKGFSAVNKGIGSITGSGGPISKLVSPFTELISKIPIVGGLIGGVVDMLAGVADYATEAGSQVQLFARGLSISVADATKLNAQYSNIAHNSGDLLFNAKKFRETQLEIAEATGLNNLLSEKSLQTQIQLKELAGTDLETRKELTNVERISGVQQDKIVKASMGTSAYIKQTLGVSIKWQSILKEATSLSGVLGLSFAKYPEKLTRSLATVKSMGLELKQLDGIADSFLDFESSISKEFEAQLLTGKDINLTKAREAFLNNDLVTAGKELVNQLGTSGEFLNYNRIQQEALAASAGMTRDQVADMLKQQELFSKFQVSDLKGYQQKVALMSKTIEGQKELISLLGQEEYSKVMSQTATEKIANFIEKIKQSFADLLSSSSFKGFLDKVINFISDPKNIEALLSKITGFISVMIKAVASVLSGLDQLPFVEIDQGIISSIRGYADELSSAKLGSLLPTGASIQKNQVQNEVGSSSMSGDQSNRMKMGAPTIIIKDYSKIDPYTAQKNRDIEIQTANYDSQTGDTRSQTSG